VSRTQTLLTKIRQVHNEICDIKSDAQSCQGNNKYVYSINRKHTKGAHIINKINIQRQKKDDIVNNHKAGREDIYGKEHRGYSYSTDKNPTCLTDAENSVYNHDGCEELPTQTLLCLTPERPNSSHASTPDPSESTVDSLELPPSSPTLSQSSSPSDPLPLFSFELSDWGETSSSSGKMSDSELDSVLEGVLGHLVEPSDLGKGVLQRTAKEELRSTPPTKADRTHQVGQKDMCGHSHACPPDC
jgi:hypothetical protein